MAAGRRPAAGRRQEACRGRKLRVHILNSKREAESANGKWHRTLTLKAHSHPVAHFPLLAATPKQ